MKGRYQTTHADIEKIRWILKNLRLCLEQAHQAHCPQAAKAIARAVKSADSARRYAERRFAARWEESRRSFIKNYPKEKAIVNVAKSGRAA